VLLQGNQGQTGKQVGQNLTVGLGEYSEVLATELMPRYYENTYRGQKFSCLYASAALATAAAASSFILYNPTGSGKNLVLTDAYIAFTALTAVATGTDIVLGWAPVATTPGTIGALITPANCFIGNGTTSVAKAAPTATLGTTPTFARVLGSLYGDLAAADQIGIHDDIGGAIIIAPGFGVAIFGVNGTPADISIAPCLTWDEVPI
jgi:hypothetical protein